MIKVKDSKKKYLIVNADDYGYFPCVSSGILSAARSGVVTATSVMANRPGIEEHLSWLSGTDRIDIGIHLNATYGVPISTALKDKMSDNQGEFKDKYWWVYRSSIDRAMVRDLSLEWRAQIERCLDQGIKIKFLNSHEHVHMLPKLFPVACKLAKTYNIQFVRYSTPDWFFLRSLSGAFRNSLMQALCVLDRRSKLPAAQPRMFGLSASGRLDLDYLEVLVERLKPGEVGELMCHPGACEDSDIFDSDLLDYHEWNTEMAALLGDQFRALRTRKNVELIGYTQLGEMI